MMSWLGAGGYFDMMDVVMFFSLAVYTLVV